MADTKTAVENKKDTTPEKPAKKEKAAFGHRKGAQSGNISDLVAEQTKSFTPAALADKLKIPVGRVADHLRHLEGRGILEENSVSGEFTLVKLTKAQRASVDASPSNPVMSEEKSDKK